MGGDLTLSRLCVVLAAGLVSATALAGQPVWQPTGGPPGERTVQLSVSTRDPGRVLAATDTGIYLSTDGGGRWTLAQPARYAVGVAFSLAFPDRAWAVSGWPLSIRAYTSFDGGASWEPVGSDTSAVHAISYGLLVHPVRQGWLALALARGIWTSRDAGATWSVAWTSPSRRTAPVAIVISGPPATLVLVDASDDRPAIVLRSTDWGRSWRRPLASPGCAAATLPGVDGTSGAWLVCDDGAVWRTHDLGVSWRLAGQVPLVPGSQPVWISRPRPGGPLLVMQVNPGDEFRQSLWTSPDEGVSWIQQPGFPPGAVASTGVVASRGRLLAATSHGPYASADGGLSWASSGAGMVFSRTDMLRVFDADGEWIVPDLGGHARSDDYGQTWTWIEDEPVQHNSGLEIRSASDDSWRYRQGSTAVAALEWERSSDQGQSWQPFHIPGRTWYPLVWPAPGLARVLYVWTFGGRYQLLRSDSAGDDWIKLPSPFPDQVWFGELAVDRNDPWHVLAAVPWAAMMASRDGGLTWEEVGPTGMRSVVQDAVDAQLWLAVGDGVLARSEDGGATWTSFTAPLDYPTDALAVPGVSGGLVLYDRGFTRWALDGGTTWQVTANPVCGGMVAQGVAAGDPPLAVAPAGGPCTGVWTLELTGAASRR